LLTVTEAIQIQASRSAVWREFAAFKTWQIWNQEVISASWVKGKPWQDGASFSIEHRTLLGLTKQTSYTVRMCVEGRSAVYESCVRFPLTVVSTVQLSDSLGGCRLEASHSYGGPATLLLWVLLSRQRKLLRQAMRALKAHVERRP
jgi:hypothetical protein